MTDVTTVSMTIDNAKIAMTHAVKTVMEKNGGMLPTGRTDVLGVGGVLIRVYGTDSGTPRVQLTVHEAVHFDASIGKVGRLGKVKSWIEAS